MKRIGALIYVFFTVLPFVLGQSKEGLLKVKKELNKLADDPALKGGFVGFSLRSPSGEIIASNNDSKALIPASNLKLITTATALKLLGDDFKFETKFYYKGVIKDGVLNGDIIVRGGGDPSLGTDRIPQNPSLSELISEIIAEVKKLNIRKIEGSIILDNSIFNYNSIPDGWIWGDIGNYYGAGASGLNINENTYKIFFKPGKFTNDTTSILRLEPNIPGITIDNKVKTGMPGSGDNAYIFGSPYTNYRYISGTIPAGVNEFPIKGAIPDPGRFFVEFLIREMLNEQIELKSPTFATVSPVNIDYKSCSLIYVHTSPVLKDLILYTNHYSINLYAECIFRMMAVKQGLHGNVEDASDVVINYWKERGNDVSFIFMNDGSGLSPQNGIKPSFMTDMLFKMSKDSLFKSFFASLPIAGESGTLTKFCKGTKAEKNVFAKSGSLNRVLGYSGYIKGSKGDLYSFCVFVNNYNGKSSLCSKKIEQLLSLITEL